MKLYLRFFVIIIVLILLKPVSIKAQSTNIKLPTTDNSSSFDILKNDGSVISQLFGDGGFYLSGSLSSGAIPVEGAGVRLMWYPSKGAFRAGDASGSDWDDANIGLLSTAFGASTKATGYYSTAFGLSTTASGNNGSVSMGANTTAGGTTSMAFGTYSSAIGDYSVALGFSTIASGVYSTSIGNGTHAYGKNSTSCGYMTTADGDYSTSMGNYVSTNSNSGSFIIGDKSTTTVLNNTAINQMMMRFDGGYYLYSNSGASAGVSLAHNGGSWASISDSTKKYAFLPVNGEKVLNKISRFNLRSWSYKDQDSTKYRHYGPMAQEFYSAFGHDKYGVIGNDTTIASLDFSGVNLIAIKALVQRTDKLKNKTDQLNELQEKLNEQNKQIESLKNKINEFEKMKSEFTSLKETLSSFVKQKEILNNKLTSNEN